MMPIGGPILTLGVPFLAFVCFWVLLSFLGRPRNKLQFLDPLLRVEYRSLVATVCELHWISYILPGLSVSPSLPIRMFCDNKTTLHIMANPVFHEHTKHLYIDCHVVRNQYRSGFVLPSFVRSKEQLADIFTKNLSGPLFASLLSELDLFSLLPGPSCGGAVGMVTQHTGLEEEDDDSAFQMDPG
ncbi:UNVERIFIED_CONTAM: hypothetical protein Sradi_0151600 [Sesamum radiatum]|uniref:Uncharacterized protein n=1 Tax=Sesamum radiatum TaxID=300843 RepID=A0AAW2WNN9_SESRA